MSEQYELLVEFHSFFNSDGRRVDDTCISCCDGNCPANKCDYFFSICQTPAENPVSYSLESDLSNCTSLIVSDITTIRGLDMWYNFSESVLGLSNPIIFTGDRWVSSCREGPYKGWKSFIIYH